MGGPSLMRAAALVLALCGRGASHDLDPCASKPTYTKNACPADTAVACWSVLDSNPWICVLPEMVGEWAATALTGDTACRAKVSSKGDPYDGACTFLIPSSSAPWPPLPTLLPWDEAYGKAKDTLGQMNADEKHTLLQGMGWDDSGLQKWWYVGNTAAIDRLNIPSLNMQDASGGFRTYWNELVGTVTCWPSLLAISATWDPSAVRLLAVALGKEFAGKGANTILGPSIDVHRVARNGRNFEYLSGEDPYLGSKLAAPYVEGVQSQGVLAIMKHWIFNVQETNRDSESSEVSDKTAWELYYPPFQAAVEAGVSGVMCSYNKVDGQYSCGNEKTLKRVLKGDMGFKGFVQSDWWATKSMTMAMGLDQEMPGSAGEAYFSPDGVAGQSPEVVDEAVTRILAAMYHMNLTKTTKCSPPNCEEWYKKKVTSDKHAALARTLAAESIVLLKNEDDVLPLSGKNIKTLAIVGAPAVAEVYNPSGDGQGGGGEWWPGDYYSGGGSGHIVAANPVKPLDGIKQRAEAAGIDVVSSPTDDVDAAVSAAADADVCVVVAATTGQESKDRENLNLDGGANELIDALAARGHPVVVIMQVPGAVVMPWRDGVAAILVMFLGGQATGAAWADVLFGDHAPTGRLPLMMPATEDDTIPPVDGDTVTYSEGLETSYRSKTFKAAFPFGHGLSYTSFRFLQPMVVPCKDGHGGADMGDARSRLMGRRLLDAEAVLCLRAPVQNMGDRAGKSVVQMYLEFPEEAGYPSAMLRGFQKTGVLLPGALTGAVLRLTRRDLSYYSEDAGGWQEAKHAIAHIGASSEDLQRSLPIKRDSSTEEWGPADASQHKGAAIPSVEDRRPPSRLHAPSPATTTQPATTTTVVETTRTHTETEAASTATTTTHAETTTTLGKATSTSSPEEQTTAQATTEAASAAAAAEDATSTATTTPLVAGEDAPAGGEEPGLPPAESGGRFPLWLVVLAIVVQCFLIGGVGVYVCYMLNVNSAEEQQRGAPSPGKAGFLDYCWPGGKPPLVGQALRRSGAHNPLPVGESPLRARRQGRDPHTPGLEAARGVAGN